jgi:hypothetical protein
MFSTKKVLVGLGAGVSVAAIVIAGPAGVASAKSLITGTDIKNGTIHSADLAPALVGKLKGQKGDAGPTGTTGATGAKGATGATGANGKDGVDGKDGVAGLYYVTAKYGTNVATDPTVSVNEGAIATVACKLPTDTAIAGGVQTLGVGGQPAAVASSFPGRMDWNTNTPKVDRLDGWIVQFDARKAPVKADIWALCATDTKVPQTVTTIS